MNIIDSFLHSSSHKNRGGSGPPEARSDCGHNTLEEAPQTQFSMEVCISPKMVTFHSHSLCLEP